MKELKGACLFGLSGGPTSVINATALGIIKEAKISNCIDNIYALKHGVAGILNEEFYDMSYENECELEKLFFTPAAIFGSVRKKLDDFSIDSSEYERILEVFIKYNIRFFFYIGGNDSMDTCNKISKFFNTKDYECRIIGVPKTIDNDLAITDHSPGFGSAAKYVAQSIVEVKRDMYSYNRPALIIFEIMGRNAGWLTAASSLADITGFGPDLIFLPEIPITLEAFYESVKKEFESKEIVIVAISEGVKGLNGKYLMEEVLSTYNDSFGHIQLGGVGNFLGTYIHEKIPNIKIRTIEFNLLQRCASHSGSFTDAKEAYEIGRFAVAKALEGYNDKMAIITRVNNNPYQVKYALSEIQYVANFEKKVPLDWIKKDFKGMTKAFFDYATPLIEGETPVMYKNGLPDFANLKFKLVDKS